MAKRMAKRMATATAFVLAVLFIIVTCEGFK